METPVEGLYRFPAEYITYHTEMSLSLSVHQNLIYKLVKGRQMISVLYYVIMNRC